MRVLCTLFALAALIALAPTVSAESEEDGLQLQETLCGVDLENASPAVLESWAESAGGAIEGRQETGSLPSCPFVIPECVGLVPITCPPKSCVKSKVCADLDQGYSSCALSGSAVFNCTGGTTVHKRVCACDSICAQAWCAASSSTLICK